MLKPFTLAENYDVLIVAQVVSRSVTSQLLSRTHKVYKSNGSTKSKTAQWSTILSGTTASSGSLLVAGVVPTMNIVCVGVAK